ncbi:MAG: exodeoxyribonuclease I [Candidatus Saccharibacteria bacterium]|nr:exodeoxyribonuclease I [Candidatus Saccharibacteria bacterium]
MIRREARDKFKAGRESFFFYDLETSGLNPRSGRIMQFAGQRTDLELNLIGEPVNMLVKMTEEVLPDPGAIMVTKITPQQTLREGILEAEFSAKVQNEIFTEGTIAVGYNTVRFDDEFMRALFWRNFYDPYEWEWKDGRSRWDLLDAVRITRALRPEGINWPVTEEGKATNRLELLTKLNGLEHSHAHDALSDVYATIAVAKMLKEKQPSLFNFLFSIRGKNEVKKYLNLEDKRPVVYASGRYPAEFNKTTVVFPLTSGRNGNILVYDLRYNLEEVLAEEEPKLFPTVKELALNKCPAIAPIGVLEKTDGWAKIGLTEEVVRRNLATLLKHPEFAEQMRSKNEEEKFKPAEEPEAALYDGFLGESDKIKVMAVRNADGNRLLDFHPDFSDPRLSKLLLHYKGRNFPESLAEGERKEWEEYKKEKIKKQAPSFLAELERVYHQDEFIGEELRLYFESKVELG